MLASRAAPAASTPLNFFVAAAVLVLGERRERGRVRRHRASRHAAPQQQRLRQSRRVGGVAHRSRKDPPSSNTGAAWGSARTGASPCERGYPSRRLASHPSPPPRLQTDPTLLLNTFMPLVRRIRFMLGVAHLRQASRSLLCGTSARLTTSQCRTAGAVAPRPGVIANAWRDAGAGAGALRCRTLRAPRRLLTRA
eukprot:366278-Chlamydomonas_euryale.AAC.29